VLLLFTTNAIIYSEPSESVTDMEVTKRNSSRIRDRNKHINFNTCMFSAFNTNYIVACESSLAVSPTLWLHSD
jgi:hypothetical protein